MNTLCVSTFYQNLLFMEKPHKRNQYSCYPLIPFAAPVIQWTENDLDNINIKTRKTLKKEWGFPSKQLHPAALYEKIIRRQSIDEHKRCHSRTKQQNREKFQRRIKEDTVLKIIEHNNSLNTTMSSIEDHDMAHKKKSLHGKLITENKFLNNTFDWLKNEGVRKELESYTCLLYTSPSPRDQA